MVGFEGAAMPDPFRLHFKEHPFGGVILFSRNYSGKEQIKGLCKELQNYNTSNNPDSPPLFIGVDQEGGRVLRFGPPFFQSPSNRIWGELNDLDKTLKNAEEVGKELREAGININFAPCLDVDTNPDNPIIGDRSYGTDSQLVARHGAAAIHGFSKGRVFPVGKHFPGHGDTFVDSHIDLPSVDTTPGQLEKTAIVPFARGLANGLEMIMTAHVLYNKIDSRFPATFSRKILSEMLRKGMGFKGLIFTDDMEMGAISKRYDFSESCLLALEAGADILLVCHKEEKQALAFRTIYDAVRSGKISEKRIDESIGRIMRLKGRL